jgi:hypothetical protein
LSPDSYPKLASNVTTNSLRYLNSKTHHHVC